MHRIGSHHAAFEGEHQPGGKNRIEKAKRIAGQEQSLRGAVLRVK